MAVLRSYRDSFCKAGGCDRVSNVAGRGAAVPGESVQLRGSGRRHGHGHAGWPCRGGFCGTGGRGGRASLLGGKWPFRARAFVLVETYGGGRGGGLALSGAFDGDADACQVSPGNCTPLQVFI